MDDRRSEQWQHDAAMPTPTGAEQAMQPVPSENSNMSVQARRVLHRLFPEIPIDAEWEVLLGGLLAAAFVFSTLMGWVPHFDVLKNLTGNARHTTSQSPTVVAPTRNGLNAHAVTRTVTTIAGDVTSDTAAIDAPQTRATVLGTTIESTGTDADAAAADSAAAQPQIRVPSVAEVAALDSTNEPLVFDTLIPAESAK